MPTTYHESKGLPVLEALASGVPVVLPEHGAFPELIEWTGGGVLVEPNSRAALVDGLTDLLDDSEGRTAMGRAGRQAVHEKFSDDAMATATLKEYERVLCMN
jgi:glycosyltransferase involved in cell wall biosynthesis